MALRFGRREGRTGQRSAVPIVWEIVGGAVLAALLVMQLVTYPITEDPDPDGYVTYANHLKSAWTLLDFRRLPGYPFFLAVVDSIGPSTMHVDVYWTQIGVFVLWVAALWFWIRRLAGPLVALVFLALLAAPSYYTKSATVMLGDLLGSIGFGLSALVLLSFVRADSRRSAVWRLALLVPLFGATYLVHPTAAPILALLTVCLGLAVVVYRGRLDRLDGSVRPIRPVLSRLTIALVALVAVAGIASAVADRGSGRFNTAQFATRVLSCLPPASDTEDDRRIEAMKAEASKILGYPVAHGPPLYPIDPFYDLYIGNVPGLDIPGRPEVLARYRTLADLDGGQFPDARFVPLWRGRILAHPLELLRCNLLQALWRYHVVVKQYAPFTSEGRLTLYTYLPETDSFRSRLYRATGIELLDVAESAGRSQMVGPLLREIARIASFVVLIVAGARWLLRRFPVTALAVIATIAVWTVFLITVHVLDARYYAFFAPAIYLAEAAGLVALARGAARLVGFGRSESALRT